MSRRTVVSVAVSVGTLGILLWLVDIDALLAVIAGVEPGLAGLGVGVLLGSYGPVTRRWQILQRAAGYETSIGTAFEIVTISYGANTLLPANTGDLARSKISQRYFSVDGHAELLGLVLFERFLDVLTIGVLLGLSALFIGYVSHGTIGLLLASVGVVTLAVVLGTRSSLLERTLAILPSSVRPGVSKLVLAHRDVTGQAALAAAIWSLVRWLLVALALVLFAASLSVAVDPPVAVLVVSAMGATAIVPLSPGGIGPVDAAGAGLLTLAGFPLEFSLSVVLLHRSAGIVLVAVLALGVYNYRTLVGSPK